MASSKLSELKSTIDFGLITTRQDEYEAVLERFPGDNNAEGERNYRISDVLTDETGKFIRVAIARCNQSGEGEAQSVAHDMIADLAPSCLLAVGIAGGIRDDDFSLGDVIVATHIHDFSVEAVLKGGGREFNLSGGPVPKAVQNLAVSLKAHEKELGDWAHDIKIPVEIPPADYQNPDKYYGPEVWKQEVFKSLEKHFKANKPHSPKVVDGPIASSDRLIKNAEITEELLSFVRSTKAVEMEVAGVYRAARGTKKDYLLTTIRGISDVIGFRRDDSWTKYACKSAAAFTYAFVKSGLLISPKSILKKEIPSPNINKSQGTVNRVERQVPKPATRHVIAKHYHTNSLLAPRLERFNVDSLADVSEKDKWQVILEVVNDMYKLLYRPLDKFSPSAFESFEMDLSALMEAIADAPNDYSYRHYGSPKILEHLGICRVKASLAKELCMAEEPAHRNEGRLAAIELQTNLKKALEYIKTITESITE